MNQEILDRASHIRLVVLDVDGVLTDGSICMGAEGELMKAFNVRDGLGIVMLKKAGIDVAIITGRESKILEARARELGITDVYQGQRFKLPAFEALLKEKGVEPHEVAYMGDDVPDLPILKRVGLSACPKDADTWVKDVALWTAPHAGGHGAVRDLAELVLDAEGLWVRLVTETFIQGK